MARAYSAAASRRQPAAAQRSVGRSRQRGSGSAAVGLALGRAAAWGRAAAVRWPGVAPRVLVSGRHSVHWGDNGLLVCVRVRKMNRMKEIRF